MLADALAYQQSAVAKALHPQHIRPRILIADAVGLGKTLEIGMILSELVRRGRGERSPPSTSSSRFSTSCGAVSRCRSSAWTPPASRRSVKLPATRNPFTYFKRAIISIDTLKSPCYKARLEHQRWDAVGIDESHNLTKTGTMNNELARVLAPNTEALILASATPHNGKEESFAELLRLLDRGQYLPRRCGRGTGGTLRHHRSAGVTLHPAARAPACRRRSHAATIRSGSRRASALAR